MCSLFGYLFLSVCFLMGRMLVKRGRKQQKGRSGVYPAARWEVSRPICQVGIPYGRRV